MLYEMKCLVDTSLLPLLHISSTVSTRRRKKLLDFTPPQSDDQHGQRSWSDHRLWIPAGQATSPLLFDIYVEILLERLQERTLFRSCMWMTSAQLLPISSPPQTAISIIKREAEAYIWLGTKVKAASWLLNPKESCPWSRMSTSTSTSG